MRTDSETVGVRNSICLSWQGGVGGHNPIYNNDLIILLCKNFLFYIGIHLINNLVIVSGEEQRDSAIRIHVSILPQTPLLCRLPHDIEQSSLWHMVGPCWLPTLNITVVHVHPRLPNYPFPHPSPLATVSSLSKSVSLLHSLSKLICVIWVLPISSIIW